MVSSQRIIGSTTADTVVRLQPPNYYPNPNSSLVEPTVVCWSTSCLKASPSSRLLTSLLDGLPEPSPSSLLTNRTCGLLLT
jgi:hypothetical protein